jgi:hypothetical protein
MFSPSFADLGASTLESSKSTPALVNISIGNDSFWRGSSARARAAKPNATVQVSPQNEFFI